jgi:hypothetical protein
MAKFFKIVLAILVTLFFGGGAINYVFSRDYHPFLAIVFLGIVVWAWWAVIVHRELTDEERAERRQWAENVGDSIKRDRDQANRF